MNTFLLRVNPISVFLYALMLSQPLIAQTTPYASPSDASEKRVMTVRLLLPSPMACVGQPSLDLEAVLTNSTERSVELSADGVVHNITFQKYVSGKPIDGTGLLLDFKPEHWITIGPHQSIVVPFTEPITAKLFGTPGIFSVEIEFGVILKNKEQYSVFPGSILSNKTVFLLSDCNGDPKTISSDR
jgi:hypothetical protein